MFKRLLFHNFRTVYQVSTWFRSRLTSTGSLVLGMLMTGALFGIDTRKTFAYQLFTLSLALLCLAMFSGLWFRPRFRVQRQLPRYATVGETLEYRIRLDNLSPRHQPGWLLRDQLDQTLPSLQTFLQTTRSVGRYNWFDNYVGYPRWVWLIQKQRGAVNYWQQVPTLIPAGSADLRVQLLPLRRGYIHLSGVQLARTDPFGLFRSIRYQALPERLLVLPIRYTVPPLALPGSRKHQPGGVNLAMSVGDAVEFVALREYRPGDPLRHIHWRSWARQGKPIVKELQDEFFVRHALILDTFATPAQHVLFEAGVSVAASFVSSLVTQDTLLDLLFVGDQAYCFTGGRGLVQINTLLEILACVEITQDKAFSSLQPLVAQHTASLSGCLCVLLTWDDARAKLVSQLRSLNLPLRALVLTAGPSFPALTLPAQVSWLRLTHLQADLQQL